MPETEFILYQTLEDRGKYFENEEEGPYECNWENSWLGDGYYFWYHHIDLAHWWGESRYGEGKYVIFKSICGEIDKCWDLHLGHGQELFLHWVKKLKEVKKITKDTTVKQIIEFIKGEFPEFNYEGIRILGVNSISENKIQEETRFKFEKKNKKDYNRQRHKAYFDATPPIQVCLFKKTSMGRKGYDVVYPYEYCSTMLY